MSQALAFTVAHNLNDAIENGYSFSGWTPEEIAADLVAFAADLEEHDAADLVPHVNAWLSTHREA